MYIMQHYNTKLAAVLTKHVALSSNKNNLDTFLCMELSYVSIFGYKT